MDNHAQLRQIYNTDLWGDGAVDGFGSKMGVFERSVVQVAPQREVLSVSYLMHSGVGHKFDFQRPLVLTTTQVAVEPTLRKIRPLQKSNSKALRCEALFNPR